MSEHEWCRDTARDEAVRAAEDAAAVPSIQHRDLPEQVSLLWASLGDILGRVVRLEGEMDAGEAEEAAPAVCDLASPADGLRTERVTLEIVYDPQFWHDPSTWAWSAVLKGRTKTVRVVDADAVTDEARPTTLRERTPGEAAAYAQGMAATVVADLIRERDAARAEASRLRARVAELEQQIKLDDRWAAAAPAANAGGEAKQEPVAWAVLGRGIIRAISVSRSDAEDAQSQFACDTTVVPLYATPPEPRGWLTAEERGALERAFDLLCDDDGDQLLAGTVQRLLARSSPPRVKVPMCGSDFHWIAAIREAGVEVEE